MLKTRAMRKRAKEEKLLFSSRFNSRGGCIRFRGATAPSEPIPTPSLSSRFCRHYNDRGILNDLIQDGSFVSEGSCLSTSSPVDFSKEDYEEMMSVIEDEYEYQCSQLSEHFPFLLSSQ